MRKSDWYKHLFARVDTAIAEDYYFEAAFICYGIVEDRLHSLMDIYQLPVGFKGVAKKIKSIAKVRSTSAENLIELSQWDGGKYKNHGRLKEALAWGEMYRNPMQHFLGDPRRYEASVGNFHTVNSKDLAIEGKNVARNLSALVMRCKREYGKGQFP